MRQLCGLALLLAPCAWGETRVERNNPVPIFPYCGWSILIRKTADFLPDEPEAVCIAGNQPLYKTQEFAEDASEDGKAEPVLFFGDYNLYMPNVPKYHKKIGGGRLPPVQDDSPPLEHVHYGGDGVYCSMASGYPLFACPSGDDALPDKNTEVFGPLTWVEPNPGVPPEPNPCFAKNTTACRLLTSAKLGEANAAYAECYGADDFAGQAELVPMSELGAGDLVLTSSREGGGLGVERVVVNQHVKSTFDSPLIQLHHSGEARLDLTPDHMIYLDGTLAPAREAKVGSLLSLADGETAKVQRVSAYSGPVVNPVTVRGTILASNRGVPVLASTHAEWTDAFHLDGVVPLPFFHLLSYLTPKQLQAYHDAVIEPLHDEGPAHNPVAGLTALPPVLTGIGALALDVVSAIGFVAYTCAVSKTLTLTTLAAAALVTRGARKAM